MPPRVSRRHQSERRALRLLADLGKRLSNFRMDRFDPGASRLAGDIRPRPSRRALWRCTPGRPIACRWNCRTIGP